MLNLRFDFLLGSVCIAASMVGCGSSSPGAPPVEAQASAEPDAEPDAEPNAEIPDPVARLNGVDIPRSTLIERLDRLGSAHLKGASPRVVKQTLRFNVKMLIDKALVDQAIEAANLPPEPEADKAAWDAYVAAYGGDEGIERFAKAANTTKARLRAGVHRRLALRRLFTLRGDFGVTPQQVRAVYDENPARFQAEAYVTVREIVLEVKPQATETEIEAVRQRALQLRAQALEEGADFAALSKTHSEVSAWGRTPPADGLLRFDRSCTVPQVAQAVFATPVGDIAEPVRSRHGWHILKTIGRQEARLQPFEEVRELIRARLDGQQEKEAHDALIEELRSKARIEIFID